MAEQETRNQAGATTAPAQPVQKRRRWLRAIGWALATLVLAIALAVTGLLWWMGRDDSLNQTLQRVAGWMPADQTLVAKNVTGSVKNGGHIGWLQWQSPTMKVEVKDAKIGWQLRPLIFSRALKLAQVHIAEVQIASTPDPDKKPSEPMQSLTLPLKIELPFKIDQIIWQGPPEVAVQDLIGNYEYTGTHHELHVRNVHVADGHYQMLARMQGAAPMQLKVELQGELQTPNPLQARDGKATDLIKVLANAQLEGTLATQAAKLGVTAHAEAQITDLDKNAIQPNSSKRKQLEKDEQSVLADIRASIMPWREQPLLSANAALQNVDIAAFWPQGPRTLLSGELKATPGADAVADSARATGEPAPGPYVQSTLDLSAHFSNAMPGPWDRQRLPVRQLQVQANLYGGQWRVADSAIDIGKGSVQLSGNFYADQDAAGPVFDGKVNVQQLNPADIYSTLEAAPLQGSITARTEPAPVPVNTDGTAASSPPPIIAFAMDLKAAGNGSKNLRIQTLAAKGQWEAPLLQLEKLQIDALQAHVHAQALAFNTETQQVKAQLKADAPGAKLDFSGHINPKTGNVQSQLQLSSLSALAQWLRKLPGIKDPLAGARLDGTVNAQLQLQGGWENLLKRLSAAHGAPMPASGLQLQASVHGEKIRYQAAGIAADKAMLVPALQLTIKGSPENAAVTLTAQAQQADQSVQLDTAVQAGLASDKSAAPLDWQASLEKLQAQLKPGKDKPGPWIAQLQPGAPVQITQRTSGKTVLSTVYQLSAGRLQITPPNLGMRRTSTEPLAPVQLSWNESTLTHLSNAQWGVRSSGKAQAIPLAWVDAFSTGDDDPPLAAAGLSGDLSFNGNWNLDTLGKDLKADLTVERASGDLRLAVDDGSGTTVIQTTGPTATKAGSTRTRTISGSGMRARIKDVRLNVQAQGSQVNARLIWDSERAGSINADMRTQLSYQQGAWSLPGTAPLSGQLHAKMPDIGIWALFAPPGWRVKGSLAADATIGGTVQDPNWQGNINAEQLSILSLLDGLDLQDGVLRARLQGTRLDITELRIKGGKGSHARILGYSGNLTAAPEDGGLLTGSGYAQFTPPRNGAESGLSMNLQAKASKLQVLVRADRQVSVSGDLLARLEQGQFTLRGDLTVDRASIILPEESAPSLDKDVVVHSAASRKAAEEERQRAERNARKEEARATPRKMPDILVKLNMGRDFALQGYGIVTRLRGQLEVKGANQMGGSPSVTGEIRTEQGRYRAWGQSLDVDNGLIRFNGPYNNPSLDILALRPNISVKAGVQVLGTANAPRVLLYSDPDLPDAEKLSWVVMGRDPASGGASSALLQQAAMALLAGGNSSSGKIAGSLGLDEVGFKGGGDGSDASGAALTLGKRLSEKLYVTYEQSLSGAMGLIYIFYDLSRSVTVRAQTGMTSALDLVYTLRKD